jgi:hypothetical protein
MAANRAYNRAYDAATEAEQQRKCDGEKAATVGSSVTLLPASFPSADGLSPATINPTDPSERAAKARFDGVCERVALASKSGELVTGWRPRKGGHVEEIPQAWWNTEGTPIHRRFREFGIDPLDPFCGNGQPVFTDSERFKRQGWLCISRDSLDKFVGGLGSSPTLTAKDESDAVAYLTNKLKQDPDLKRADAKDECERFRISERGFLDRVWPKARERAGLSAVAPPGRKRTKNRSA